MRKGDIDDEFQKGFKLEGTWNIQLPLDMKKVTEKQVYTIDQRWNPRKIIIQKRLQ